MRSSITLGAGLCLAGAVAAHADIGDIYMFDNRGSAEFFTVSPANPSTRNFINSNAGFLCFAMDFDQNGGTLYATNNSSNEFGTINPNTGAFTSIGAITGLGAGENTTGITIAPNGDAYLSTHGTQSFLYRLNLVTGAASLIGQMAGSSLMIDIAADTNGRLFGHDIGADALMSIDSLTGAATFIGNHGLAANFAQGMDFDWSTNTLYATIYTGSGAGQLVSWDTSTGGVTTIVDTTPWNAELEMSVRSPIPAPASVALLSIGVVGAGGRRR